MLALLDQWRAKNGVPSVSHTTTSTNPTPVPRQRLIRLKELKTTTSNFPVPAKGPEVPTDSSNPPQVVVLEPSKPLSAFNDDAVTDTVCAAQILGVNAETLKKWRQRNQGPDYIQYGPGGPVRYALSALKAFREAHTIRIQNNVGIGGRRRRRSQ